MNANAEQLEGSFLAFAKIILDALAGSGTAPAAMLVDSLKSQEASLTATDNFQAASHMVLLWVWLEKREAQRAAAQSLAQAPTQGTA